MNKYLLMCAAAVLGGTCQADAGVHSFVFGTPGGGCYCSGGTAYTNIDKGHIAAAWTHNSTCPSGTSSQGAGLLQKVKGLGDVWVLSDNYLAKKGVYNEYLSFTLPKIIRDRGVWTLWIGFSGVSNFEGNSGVLWFVTSGPHGVRSRGHASTLSKVNQLIMAHRQ